MALVQHGHPPRNRQPRGDPDFSSGGDQQYAYDGYNDPSNRSGQSEYTYDDQYSGFESRDETVGPNDSGGFEEEKGPSTTALALHPPPSDRTVPDDKPTPPAKTDAETLKDRTLQLFLMTGCCCFWLLAFGITFGFLYIDSESSSATPSPAASPGGGSTATFPPTTTVSSSLVESGVPVPSPTFPPTMTRYPASTSPSSSLQEEGTTPSIPSPLEPPDDQEITPIPTITPASASTEPEPSSPIDTVSQQQGVTPSPATPDEPSPTMAPILPNPSTVPPAAVADTIAPTIQSPTSPSPTSSSPGTNTPVPVPPPTVTPMARAPSSTPPPTATPMATTKAPTSRPVTPLPTASPITPKPSTLPTTSPPTPKPTTEAPTSRPTTTTTSPTVSPTNPSVPITSCDQEPCGKYAECWELDGDDGLLCECLDGSEVDLFQDCPLDSITCQESRVYDEAKDDCVCPPESPKADKWGFCFASGSQCLNDPCTGVGSICYEEDSGGDYVCKCSNNAIVSDEDNCPFSIIKFCDQPYPCGKEASCYVIENSRGERRVSVVNATIPERLNSAKAV